MCQGKNEILQKCQGILHLSLVKLGCLVPNADASFLLNSKKFQLRYGQGNWSLRPENVRELSGNFCQS